MGCKGALVATASSLLLLGAGMRLGAGWYTHYVSTPSMFSADTEHRHWEQKEDPLLVRTLVPKLRERERRAFSWEMFEREDRGDLNDTVREEAAKQGFTHAYRTYHVQLASLCHGEEDRTVNGVYRLPETAEQVAAFVILPELSRKANASHAQAAYLAHAGHATLALQREQHFLNGSTEGVKRNIEETVCNAYRAMDWLLLQPEVRKDRIGLSGISLGALLAIPVYAVDIRTDDMLQAGIFTNVGGNLFDSLMDSDGDLLTSLREEFQEGKEAYTETDFVEQLRTLTEVLEPTQYGSILATQRVELLLINARFDALFPLEKSVRPMWCSFGHPSHRLFNTDHDGFSLYLAAPSILWETAAHASRRLAPEVAANYIK